MIKVLALALQLAPSRPCSEHELERERFPAFVLVKITPL